MSVGLVTSLPHELRARSRQGLLTAATGALAASAGAAVAAGYGVPVLGGLVACGAMAIGLTHWRWLTYGLLAFFPVSGIPFVLLYPNTQPAALLKDFVFVIPAYAGFFLAAVHRRRGIFYAGFPLLTATLFSAIVLFQDLNPSGPGPLAVVVGTKVWLFYLPMMLLGYHLIDNRRALGRLLALLALTAIVPAVIGIIEAGLIYSGRSTTVYEWYGDAAAAATQDFAVLTVGGAPLNRVPSTFSFTAQYFVYLSCMAAVTFAWWRGGFSRSSDSTRRAVRATLAGGLLVLLVVAGFMSGDRGAFVVIPLILVLALLLERRAGASGIFTVLGMVLAVALTTTVIGASSAGLLDSLASHTGGQFSLVFTGGLDSALSATTFGLGTGTQTNAARYVLENSSQVLTSVGGIRLESWFVKALAELGVLGLGLLLALLATVLTRALKAHARLRDDGLRSVSAALIALLVVHTAYNVKAQYVDIDPLNVYFWLFVGLLAKIAVLDRRAAQV